MTDENDKVAAPAASVSAQFGCTAVEAVDEGFRIKLSTVINAEDNGSMFDGVPNAHITLEVVNADTAKMFVKGKQYFVDFTAAVVEAETPAPADENTGGAAAPAETLEDPAPAAPEEDVPAQPVGGEDAPESQE